MARLGLKPQYLEEMVLDLRKAIKENSYDLTNIDLKAEVLAFSFKKLDEWLGENLMATDEEKVEMSKSIFREASAAMQDCHPLYGERDDFNIINDTWEDYKSPAEDMISAYLTRSYCKGSVFYKEYYNRLEGGIPSINAMELMSYLLN